MTRTSKAITFFCLFFSLIVYLQPLTACEAPRQVRFDVAVQTVDGQSLEGVLLCIMVGTECVHDALTGADGHAVLQAELPDGLAAVEVRFGFARPSTIADAQESSATTKRQTELKTKYSFPRSQRIALDPSKIEYEVLITVGPTIDITAMIVDTQGKPQRADLFGPPNSYLGGVDRGRVRPLRGMAQNSSALLAAVSYVSWPATIIKLIPVSAEQTQANLDLGAIAIPPLPTGAVIDGKIVGHNQLRSLRTYGYWDGLTFIAKDQSLIVSYRAITGGPVGDGPLKLEPTAIEPLTLPTGTYYIAPGSFFYSDDQMALINMLRAGVDLSGSKVPTVTIQAEGPNTFTIDVLQAHDAIQEAAAKHSPPNE